MSRSASVNGIRRAGRWIDVGRGGLIAADRVVAVGRAGSAPIKRLLAAAGPKLVINLTYGEPRQTVLVLESGHLVVVSQPITTVKQALEAL
jgi:regulator of extracellular matrix RemA (YlzA/DUF370 family)